MEQVIAKMSDEEVIKQVVQGEKSLYAKIVRKYNPYLYKIGRSYNYNHEDTQDLMQETFIDAYKNLSKFEGRANFKTWIIRIMLNNCYHKRQKSSFKNEINEDTNEMTKPMFSNSNNNTDKMIQNWELRQVIEKALSDIPQEYRMVFSLREINGLSVSDTAETLDISDSNVKVRLNRAKKMLREKIEKSYAPNDIFEFNLIYCEPMVQRVMHEINNL